MTLDGIHKRGYSVSSLDGLHMVRVIWQQSFTLHAHSTHFLCLHWSLCNLVLIFHIKPKHSVVTVSRNIKEEPIRTRLRYMYEISTFNCNPTVILGVMNKQRV